MDVVLRDGSTIRLRPMQAADTPILLALLADARSSAPARAPGRASPFPFETGSIDSVLVAEASGDVVAVASYRRDGASPERAEVRFAIVPALAGRGIGTRMLERLARSNEDLIELAQERAPLRSRLVAALEVLLWER